MTARGVLQAGAAACVVAGTLDVTCVAAFDRTHERVGVAFYAQNLHASAGTPLETGAAAVAARWEPHWVQRGALVLDREPAVCTAGARRLHVFALPAEAHTYYGVMVFVRPGGDNRVSCVLRSGRTALAAYHPAGFADADALVARARFEYLGHRGAAPAAARTYPSREKPMVPVPST